MRPEDVERSPAVSNATFDEQGFLESLGLTKYETAAYLALLALGVSDARELSRKSAVPTSKIYETMVRLEALGLIEVQASRPRKFMAREVGEALEDLKGAKRREFDQLLKSLPSLETRLKLRAHTSPRDSTFWSVTTSWNDFASKHLAKAAEAQEEVLVYLDLSGSFGNLFQALKESRESGRPLVSTAFTGEEARILEALRAIKMHLREGKVNFRILVGAGPEEREVARHWVLATSTPQHYNRFRVADPGRQQFLVIDREGVGLLLMNPARVGTPLGSVFAKDPALAREITAAFEEMWDRGQPVFVPAQARSKS